MDFEIVIDEIKIICRANKTQTAFKILKLLPIKSKLSIIKLLFDNVFVLHFDGDLVGVNKVLIFV